MSEVGMVGVDWFAVAVEWFKRLSNPLSENFPESDRYMWLALLNAAQEGQI